MRARWGLAGLLGFEALLAAYTLANGAYEYAAMAAVAGLTLGWAVWAHARTGEVPRAAFVLLAVVTLVRALAQTVVPGVYVLGVMPTFLVPLGFAVLLWRPAWGIALVAAARSWFIVWYFLAGSPTLVLANAVGAAGAWLWLADEAQVARPEASAGDAAARE